jgi:hypothetical protein
MGRVGAIISSLSPNISGDESTITIADGNKSANYIWLKPTNPFNEASVNKDAFNLISGRYKKPPKTGAYIVAFFIDGDLNNGFYLSDFSLPYEGQIIKGTNLPFDEYKSFNSIEEKLNFDLTVEHTGTLYGWNHNTDYNKNFIIFDNGPLQIFSSPLAVNNNIVKSNTSKPSQYILSLKRKDSVFSSLLHYLNDNKSASFNLSTSKVENSGGGIDLNYPESKLPGKRESSYSHQINKDQTIITENSLYDSSGELQISYNNIKDISSTDLNIKNNINFIIDPLKSFTKDYSEVFTKESLDISNSINYYIDKNKGKLFKYNEKLNVDEYPEFSINESFYKDNNSSMNYIYNRKYYNDNNDSILLDTKILNYINLKDGESSYLTNTQKIKSDNSGVVSSELICPSPNKTNSHSFNSLLTFSKEALLFNKNLISESGDTKLLLELNDSSENYKLELYTAHKIFNPASLTTDVKPLIVRGNNYYQQSTKQESIFKWEFVHDSVNGALGAAPTMGSSPSNMLFSNSNTSSAFGINLFGTTEASSLSLNLSSGTIAKGSISVGTGLFEIKVNKGNLNFEGSVINLSSDTLLNIQTKLTKISDTLIVGTGNHLIPDLQSLTQALMQLCIMFSSHVHPSLGAPPSIPFTPPTINPIDTILA